MMNVSFICGALFAEVFWCWSNPLFDSYVYVNGISPLENSLSLCVRFAMLVNQFPPRIIFHFINGIMCLDFSELVKVALIV